jgi:myo-inositol-1(or 4)-monophosphatase
VAAAEAAEYLLTERPSDLRVDAKSTATDAVTAMDRGSEALLVRLLLRGGAEDGVLGEEGADRAGSSGVRWIIDPLDGTVNYLYGIPEWSVCVAAEVDGEIVAGVVHAPALAVVFSAALGSGARRAAPDGSRSIAPHLGTETRLAHALVGTGFGYDAERRRRQAVALAEIVPQVRDIRRAGSAAIDLCRVADGSYDGYFEMGLNPWDHAAAALVVTEAGGVVGGLPGEPVGARMTIAANHALFGPLQNVVARGMERAGL